MISRSRSPLSGHNSSNPGLPSLEPAPQSITGESPRGRRGRGAPGVGSGEGGADGVGNSDIHDRDPATNKYSCSRCGRSYLHQATLVRHQRYECGISASYPCALCGRKFKRRDVLKGHMEKCVNKSAAAAAVAQSAAAAAAVAQQFPATLS